MYGLRWYFPWEELDWLLRAELVLWLLAVLLAGLVWWRGVFRGHPWLRLSYLRKDSPPGSRVDKV